MVTLTDDARSPSVTRPVELTDSEVAFYQRYGYLTIPGFLTTEMAETISAEVLDVLDANGVPRDSLHAATGTEDKLRQCSQYLAGSYLDALINGPATLAVASRLIGGPAVRYLPFTAVKTGGGGGTMHFHQDNNYTQHEPATGSLNIWVALVDMTPANGCLQIVPESHARQHESHTSDDGDAHRQVDVDPLRCVPIRMRAGDAVVFTRWTVHGSGVNTSPDPRIAYALQYHRDDVRWFDQKSDSWKLLIDEPRSATPPLTRLG